VIVGDGRCDHAFVGGLVGALRGCGGPLLAEDVDRLLHVSVSLFQGLLAVGHAGSRTLAEPLDVIERNRHDRFRIIFM
jgi:hypothetical protein